jgi:hypothetical protein
VNVRIPSSPSQQCNRLTIFWLAEKTRLKTPIKRSKIKLLYLLAPSLFLLNRANCSACVDKFPTRCFSLFSSWEICYCYAEKLLAHVIFYKNSKIWKNKRSEISTYDFAFLRRRSRKLNCRKNFTNISSMESIYIISILLVEWFKIRAIKLHG